MEKSNKENNKKFYRILASGLLMMNLGALSNLILKTNINIDIIDFLRGAGIVLVLFGIIKIINNKRNVAL